MGPAAIDGRMERDEEEVKKRKMRSTALLGRHTTAKKKRKSLRLPKRYKETRNTIRGSGNTEIFNGEDHQPSLIL